VSSAASLLKPYRGALIDRTVTHVWNGHGSALFLEFGDLKPSTRSDGSPGEPEGELELMVQWSWRIEDGPAIACGSWSDERLWRPTFDRLLGRNVIDVALFGRLPEIAVALNGDLRVVTFMTAEGEPEWTLFDRRGPEIRWLRVKLGEVVEETE
jgi:hypothetical protein